MGLLNEYFSTQNGENCKMKILNPNLLKNNQRMTIPNAAGLLGPPDCPCSLSAQGSPAALATQLPMQPSC